MLSRFSPYTRLAALALAATTAIGFMAVTADARVGGGRSTGSRGSQTFTPPPATNTAPKPAAPMERSMTQPGKSTAAAPAAGVAGKAAGAAASQSSRFGGMFRGLLLGGLLGAGLASIFGAGALASVLGFILQTALIAGIIFLIVSFFRNRNAQPAMANATAGAGAGRPQAQNASYRMGMPAGGAGVPAIQIGPDDYSAFERLLGDIQNAYGRGDQKALGHRVTPEMLSYFAQDLADDAKQGLRNEVRFGKLLQGDLAEAWSEPDGDYATVAMRYSISDAKIEIASGRVIEGSKTEEQQVTEIWTFRRPRGGNAGQWELSAIQQS